jgi:BirA family biotin operon repressor/biotin-[acetyl-CoA-carboxylase] ligase
MILLDKNKHLFIESVNSTQKYIQDPNIPIGSWISCKIQTEGKGRKSNHWFSIGTHKIIFSGKISIPLNQNLQLASILTGLSVYKSIHKLDPSWCKNIFIKWPNDLYKENKKIGGILIDSNIYSNEVILYIGIGINLFGNSVPTNLSNKAGYLLDYEPSEEQITELYHNIVSEINSTAICILSDDCVSEKLNQAYQYSYLQNKTVQFEYLGSLKTGVVCGYSLKGMLRICLEDNSKIELLDTNESFKVIG